MLVRVLIMLLTASREASDSTRFRCDARCGFIAALRAVCTRAGIADSAARRAFRFVCPQCKAKLCELPVECSVR